MELHVTVASRSLINLFGVFALIFCPVSLSLAWLIHVEWCFYFSVALLAASLTTLLLSRQRMPSSVQVEAFMGVGWPDGNICHRGGGNDAPENTLIAFRQARKNGATFVEFDIALTKDGIPVVIHDDTVDRTTDGTGAIKDLTLSEVLKLNAAAKHPLRGKFPHATVPTLKEATEECLSLGFNIFFDVKDGSTEMVNALASLFKIHPELYHRGMVCSLFPHVPYKVRCKDPAILTALTACTFTVKEVFGCEVAGPLWKRSLCILGDYLLLWSQSAWLWILCGNAATLINKDIVSQDTVDYWTQRGVKTIVWTVNNSTEKEYFHRCLGCGVITDSSQVS